jgi:hypothetical protein
MRGIFERLEKAVKDRMMHNDEMSQSTATPGYTERYDEDKEILKIIGEIRNECPNGLTNSEIMSVLNAVGYEEEMWIPVVREHIGGGSPRFGISDMVYSTNNPRLSYKIMDISTCPDIGELEYTVEIFTDMKPGVCGREHNIQRIICRKLDSWAEPLVEQDTVETKSTR